jgi:hypothetical protein
MDSKKTAATPSRVRRCSRINRPWRSRRGIRTNRPGPRPRPRRPSAAGSGSRRSSGSERRANYLGSIGVTVPFFSSTAAAASRQRSSR